MPPLHALIRLKRAGLDIDGFACFDQARIVSIIIYPAAGWYPFISKIGKSQTKAL